MCFAIVLKDPRKYPGISLFEPCSEILEDNRRIKTTAMTKVKVGDKEIGYQARLKGFSATTTAQTKLRLAIKREIYDVSVTEYWIRLDCEKGVKGDPKIKPVWRKNRVCGAKSRFVSRTMKRIVLNSVTVIANKNDMQTNHSAKSFSSRVQAAYHANMDMSTKRPQRTSPPKVIKGVTATGCSFDHPCCMHTYLNRPLPLTPRDHKNHINNLLAAAENWDSEPSSRRTDLLKILNLVEQAVTYANKNKLVFYEAKAQLYRGQVLLRLGYPAEASWCATRAFGWVERKTGVAGRGQRSAAKLKTETEAALKALHPSDPLRYLRDDFCTIPGRMSGVGSPKHNRRPAEHRAGGEPAERREISKWSATTTSTKCQSVESSFKVGIRLVGQDSPTSVRYIAPPITGIVHDGNGELWKVAAPRSSVLLGNKDERRTLHVVNPHPSPRWPIEEEIDSQIKALSNAHLPNSSSSKTFVATWPASSQSRRS